MKRWLAHSGYVLAACGTLAVMLITNPASGEEFACWSQHDVGAPVPAARYSHAMAFDSKRGVAVMFGGLIDEEFQGDTWEWNPATGIWTQRLPEQSPSPRGFHAMAYDAARGVTVLFGGATGNMWNKVDSGETWEWDGVNWTNVTPPAPQSSPSPRSAHAMTFDAARGVTVLFGGNSEGANGETWEWDGSHWTQRQVAGPSPRSGHAMTYDSVRQRTVLFSGWNSASGNFYRDTWEWDGTSWVLRALNVGPTARFQHCMAYDPASGFTVMFGGIDGSTPPNHTWLWNGATGQWTDAAAPAGAPSGRIHAAIAFDNTTIVFGGAVSGGGLTNQT